MMTQVNHRPCRPSIQLGTAGIIRQTFYRVAFPSARRCHSYLISLHYSLTRASSLLLSISSFICSSIPTIYFRKRFGKRLMPCISMFSRFKADRSGGGAGCTGGGGSNGAGGGGGSSSPSQTLLEGNAITTFFEIGRQTATAGPGYLWKVHDAYRKSDGKVTALQFLIRRLINRFLTRLNHHLGRLYEEMINKYTVYRLCVRQGRPFSIKAGAVGRQ